MSRPTTAKPQKGDSIPQWTAPAGVAALALLALAMVTRIRPRSPQNVAPTLSNETPRPPEVAPESPPHASAESQSEIPGVQHVVTSSGKADETSQALPVGDNESARDRLESPSDHERPPPILDQKPLSPKVPFRFLHEADPDSVLSFVTEEHPQTIALILAHLPAPLAAKVLSGLPSTKRLEVGHRVATLEETSPEILHDVAKSLRSRIASTFVSPFGTAGGASTAALRCHRTDRVRNHALLASLELEDSALADRIRRLMFVFDDLLKLDGSTVAALYARIDNSKWALALKGASEELKTKILDNVSPVTAARLHEELDELGPVRLSDVAAAQQQIVALVRRLEDSGEIVVDASAEALRMIA